jgi:hypothetical protein
MTIGLCLLYSINSYCRFDTKVLATNDQITQFLGTNQAKLVFINKGDSRNSSDTIEYIDFSENNATAVVRRITTAANPVAPVISPDGRWVVYASALFGGEAGSSPTQLCSIYLCELKVGATPVKLFSDSAFEPRFMMNPSGNKLTVVFPTHAPDFAWEGKARTMKIEIDTVGGVPVPGTATVLHQYGGYTGGLSYDSRFLCGGGGLAVMTDLNSGKSRPDTIGPIGYPDPAKMFSGQACNASITSSRTNTNVMMFLDFGGYKVIPGFNDNKPWDQWKIIFVANGNKELLRYYLAPALDSLTPYEIAHPTSTHYLDSSYTRWHHPEWSNHPYFAASAIYLRRLWGQGSNGIWNATEKQERIAFIDLRESNRYLQVVGPEATELSYSTAKSSTGLFWPWLWVKVPSNFIETPNWISSSGVKPGHHMTAPIDNGVRMQSSLLVATGKKIIRVEIFQSNGKRSTVISFPTGVSAWNTEVLKNGTYVAKIITADSRISMMRIHVVR